MFSRIYLNDGIDKYSWGNKSVMLNIINFMKYWLFIKFLCLEIWVFLKEKIVSFFNYINNIWGLNFNR